MDETIGMIEKSFATLEPAHPGFHMFRSILQKPSYYVDIERRLAQRPGTPAHKLVDLPTLLWLIKEYHDNSASHPAP